MIDRRTILEIAETEIPAAAVTYADEIFEPLLRQISEDLDEKVAALFGELSVDEIEGNDEFKVAYDIIQPAFQMHVADRLAYQIGLARDGYRQIFWGNIAERYAATGEV